MSETNPSPSPTMTSPSIRRRRMLLRSLLLLLIVVGVVLLAWYLLVARWHESTDNAYVQGNLVQITPLINGTVVAIAAEEGMRVERGQLLVQLDPSDTEVALQQAQADLARTVRQVRGMYRSVEGSQADLAAQRATLERARADYERRRSLAASGAISSEELAHARNALASAEAVVNSSREQYERNKALVDNTVLATQPDVQAAAAQLRQAYLNHARSGILSPVSGYVAKRAVQVGQSVQPGTVLMAVMPLNEIWVEANFKETQLRHMRLGQAVELKSDLYGGDVRYSGRIESLGLGTGSAFALLPAQNASGNWIKIIQRVPVRISVPTEQLAEHPLKIGLSMHADVDLHHEEGTILPAQTTVGTVFATDIYGGLLDQADALVHDIIQSNLPAENGAKL